MSVSRRLEDARQAYKKKNRQASIDAHDPKRIAAIEQHGSESSQFIGNMVYGGLDGIISVLRLSVVWQEQV